MPTSNTIVVGNAAIQYNGSAAPLQLVSGSTSSTTVAMSGANFSSLLYNPPKDVSKLPILVTSAQGTMYMITNGVLTQISGTATGYVYSARFTPSGKILFVGLGTPAASVQLFTCYPDGSGVTKLTNSGNIRPASEATMSPDEKHILFTNGVLSLFLCNADGTGETPLPRQGQSVSWAPDGQHILYRNLADLSGQITYGIATGTDIRELEVGSLPVLSPDGNYFAFESSAGTTHVAALQDLQGVGGINNTAEMPVTFSADGKMIAYMGAQNGGVNVASWTGDNPTLVSTLPQAADSISWAPFLRSRYLIGTSGFLTTSASGFLLSQAGNAFSSLFTVTATTPSTTSITPVSTDSQVFTVTADKIVSYRYMNAYSTAPLAGTPPAGSTRMLVSINSSNGQVGLIAPFAERRATPSLTRLGNRLIVRGPFVGALDVVHGKSIARAQSIILDLKSGELISHAN